MQKEKFTPAEMQAIANVFRHVANTFRLNERNRRQETTYLRFFCQPEELEVIQSASEKLKEYQYDETHKG